MVAPARKLINRPRKLLLCWEPQAMAGLFLQIELRSRSAPRRAQSRRCGATMITRSVTGVRDGCRPAHHGTAHNTKAELITSAQMAAEKICR